MNRLILPATSTTKSDTILYILMDYLTRTDHRVNQVENLYEFFNINDDSNEHFSQYLYHVHISIMSFYYRIIRKFA